MSALFEVIGRLNSLIIHLFKIQILIILTLLSFSSSAGAEAFSFSKNDTVIGLTKNYIVKENESLIEIARKFGLGYNEIVSANPDLDPFVLETETNITLPTSWILPDVETYNGMVINISEMRLYYFFKKKGVNLVATFPIGVGKEGYNTPTGNFKIIEKIVNPSWHVPTSIREKNPHLPKVIPPGPDNPLGSHALRLSSGDILIHGTNKPFGVGRKVSHGCIRLYPEHIPKLFKLVPDKASVTIIRQPVKVGISKNRVYLEVHKDKSLEMNYFDETVRLLRKKNLYDKIDKEKMIYTIRKNMGIPTDITKD